MTNQTYHALPPASVQLVSDEASGLDAVIVIHSAKLGPAAGGCRLWTYEHRSAMADDACRLAEGMSYKNALAGSHLTTSSATPSRFPPRVDPLQPPA